jgi:hypothetical protein
MQKILNRIVASIPSILSAFIALIQALFICSVVPNTLKLRYCKSFINVIGIR